MRIFGVTAQHTGLKELGTVSLPDTISINGGVRCIQYVPGLHGGVPTADPEPLRGDLVWVGTDSKRYTYTFRELCIILIVLNAKFNSSSLLGPKHLTST